MATYPHLYMTPTDASQVRKHLSDNNATTPESAIKITGLLGEIALECAKRYPEVKVTPDDRFYWDRAYVKKTILLTSFAMTIGIGVIVLVAILIDNGMI